MEHSPHPKGARVKITKSRNFLAFKYYGANGNAKAFR
jgi:hypothetical protein